jgi:hypothetical protein
MLNITSSKKKKSGLSAQEAYNIWDFLASKYFVLSRLTIWANFIHDKDLSMIVSDYMEKGKEKTKNLEKELKDLGLAGPDVGIVGANLATNPENIRDEFIAQDLFLVMQENVEMLLRFLSSTSTNDNLRKQFTRFTKEAINDMDSLVRYLRLKGWIAPSPHYPNIPPEVDEKLDAGEAFHLWDHLTFRYDNIHLTEILAGAANDMELKFLLTTGIQNVLKKQAVMLEKECLFFGIALPKHPPNVTTYIPSQYLNDDFIFRTVSGGITGATLLHAAALKQCLTNSRVRGIFKELLLSEVDIQDKIIAYGKLKGYITPSPIYKPI